MQWLMSISDKRWSRKREAGSKSFRLPEAITRAGGDKPWDKPRPYVHYRTILP
jgi:hypothetical protein